VAARIVSVAVRFVPDLPAEARVDADVLELQPEGPPGPRAEVEIATLEQLWPRSPGVSGRGLRLRADQQLAPAEVALELGPEPPAPRSRSRDDSPDPGWTSCEHPGGAWRPRGMPARSGSTSTR